MIKAILFDYGNTLMEVKKRDKENAIKKFGLTLEDYKKRHGVYVIYSLGGIKSDEEYLKHCSNFIGKKVNKDFLNAIRKLETIDDRTIDLIKKLRKKYKLALVANNVKSWVLEKIGKYGIKNLFDSIIVSSEYGIRKPDPRLFIPALNELKVKPSECIFVADELNDDLTGAKALGIKTVWLKKEDEEVTFKPDYTIKSLNEIVGILK